ncbi:MAG: aspartate--tRNA ligase [Saprospiraceae bacterium]|nr:aspartate--tRNA ligase [Saprospiraceae bacterium]
MNKYRTHNCGQLRLDDVSSSVTLSGWVDIVREFGALTFVDLRDRYGITQLVFDSQKDVEIFNTARKLGREFVIQATGTVRERTNKNPNRETGEIEIEVDSLNILNISKTPPFTITDVTDGGDDLRMKYRFLDLRRSPVQNNLFFRSRVALEVRKYLSDLDFVEVETPFLIKSTPEGARDFVVPSRLNPGQFYALPQSPQTFKQLLMVSGFDKYFQIVKCFRDEDLRADRQPEFTQIDCEMSFVTQDEILDTFEGLTVHLFNEVLGIHLDTFPRMTYDDAMAYYGVDKPDLRFDMKIQNLNQLKDHGFSVFDSSEFVGGLILETGGESFSNKDINELTEWVKRPQIGAAGLAYIKFNVDGSIKSSIGKFYSDEFLQNLKNDFSLKDGDIFFILSGETEKTLRQLGELRLELGNRFGLRDPKVFKPLWVIDFPLLEWDDTTQRFYAMHHPFTSPKKDDIHKMSDTDLTVLKSLRADAYDLVLNGVEIGGGSIRIFDRDLQARNFNLLGFTPEKAEEQFGFLMSAFEYGAPPHGGIAFGFDRLCSVMNGQNSIRDFIAFPKNNQGKDMMIDAPASIEQEQLKELAIKLDS